jgi:TPR repeat protein
MLAAADKPKETDTTSSDSESDTKATNDAQARLAKDAADRRDKTEGTESAAASDNKNEKTKAAADDEKPAPKAKPVKAAPPDPRQDSMLVAGEKYLYGRGVPQDCNQALIYFRAAAEKENGPAMSHLGAMYASGHCVTQNRVAAYKWFSRASNSEPNNQWISRNLNMIWREMSPQERASVAR